LLKRFSKGGPLLSDFGIHNGHLAIAMVRIQAKRQKKVANDIFLHWPAPGVGLGKFHGIDDVSGGDNRNQLGNGRSRRRRLSFPLRLPSGWFANVLVRFFFLSRTGNVTAQITNEGHS
jgi:hypothetical protein